jgi:ribonuclease PH
VDANFVFASDGGLVEVQACGEKGPFQESAFQDMLRLARIGAERLFEAQRQVIQSS